MTCRTYNPQHCPGVHADRMAYGGQHLLAGVSGVRVRQSIPFQRTSQYLIGSVTRKDKNI